MNRRRPTDRRSWVCGATALVAAASATFAVWPADARPVRIGRYTEIPYGVSSRHPWATQGGGARRVGRASAAAPTSAPRRVLDEPVGGRAYAPAIAENGTLYVSSAAGVLSLAPDGEVRWKRSLGLVSGTPSLTPDGHVAIGAQGGQVLVLSSERGKTRSKASVGGGVRGSPLVLADGSLVAGAFDNALHRFDAEGRRLFRSALPDRVRGPAAWNGGGTIAVAAGTHVLFMTLRGEIRARATVDDDVVAGPSIADDGTVWVLSDDAVLHALSVEGRSRARAELGGSVSISAELAVGPDGAVRVGTRSALVCIGANGTERWRLTSEGVFGGGVSVDSNGVTLALNQQGRLYAVDAAGKVLWHVDTGARTDATPVLGPDGTVYVSTFGGRLQGWR